MISINQNIKNRRKTYSTYNDLNDTTTKSTNSYLNSYQKGINIDKKIKIQNQTVKKNGYNQQKSQPSLLVSQQNKFLKVKTNKTNNRLNQTNLEALIQRQLQKKKSKSKSKNKLATLIFDDLDEENQKKVYLKANSVKKQNQNVKKILFTERIHPQVHSINQTLINSPYTKVTHSDRKLNKSQLLTVGSKKMNQSSSTITQQQIISDNFQGSFKAIFNQLIQVFYLQLFLKNILQHNILDLWNFFVQKSINFSSKQINDFYLKKRQFRQTTTSKQMIFKFLQMFEEYDVKQIKDMIHMQISTLSSIKYQDFLNLFKKDKFHVDLICQREYQNKYIKSSNQNCSLVKSYFKALIQMTHYQKILKKLIRANQRSFYHVVLVVSNGNYISNTKLTQYLTSQNVLQGKYIFNVTKIKVQTFLNLLKSKENMKVSQKITKYQFIKSMKNDQI